ncbi:MAG TPA: hypothetical protein VEQ40_07300, partial [Pyrinomonadaceae bacterium]|nr:hypothetical protein [Pyrinomonadaceae bacterium]
LKELQEMSKQRYISAYHIATVYIALKDRDSAFEWLEKAFNERADWMVFLNVDPRFESLRSGDRFRDLLRRMNLGYTGFLPSAQRSTHRTHFLLPGSANRDFPCRI